MIEEHIADCKTVVPQPNPKFNPKQYRPELIGVPKAKQEEIGLVAGWKAGGTCSLEQRDGHLMVNSTGGDPFLSAGKFKALKGGPFSVRFSMKSDSKGNGTLYYNNPPAAGRTVEFEVAHDGRLHEYNVDIPVQTLDAIRIDPARGEGTIEFGWIELLNTAGEVVRKWDFQAR